MRFVYFECTEGTKRRFYRLTIQPGLFGPVLLREWGRIGTFGQIAAHPCDNAHEVDELWRAHFSKRLKRGYKVIASCGHHPPIALNERRRDSQTPKRLDAGTPIAL